MGKTGSVTKVTVEKGQGLGWRDLVAWESHLRDGSEWVGIDGRGGGDA